MEVYAETFQLNDVVRMATSTVEPMLKDGRVRLVTEIAPDIPPLKTDRDKLKQAVLNLLSNAAKFTEQGEIKVAAWQENGNVKLTVSDTGIGMKREALDYIFDEFRQADMSSTRRIRRHRSRPGDREEIHQSHGRRYWCRKRSRQRIEIHDYATHKS